MTIISGLAGTSSGAFTINNIVSLESSNEGLVVRDQAGSTTISDATVAKKNEPQSFSARQSSIQIIADISGVYSLDLSASNTFDLRLIGNATISATNLPTQITGYTLIIRQDQVGGRTVTFNSIFQTAKGKSISLPGTLANEENVYSLISDGTRLCVLGWDAWA